MKFGILGYGFMGGAHLAAMQRIDGVTVAAVSSRTRPSADGPARGNLDLASGPLPDDVQWYADWRGVLEDPSIDAIDICLPTDLHKQVVLEAFAKGKHVFSEKPMALTVPDCEEIMAAAAKSGRTFMVGQVLRFMFPYRYAASFIEQNGRANVNAATLQRSTGYPGWGGWLGDEQRSGGAVLDLLSHDLDQALYLFGDPVGVSAVSLGPVDTMRATLRYEDGSSVVVHGGWGPSEEKFSASFRIETIDASLSFIDGVLTRTTSSGEEKIEIPADDDGYYEEIAYFVDCCRRNSLPERCMPLESAEAVRLSNMLRESRTQDGKELLWQK